MSVTLATLRDRVRKAAIKRLAVDFPLIGPLDFADEVVF